MVSLVTGTSVSESTTISVNMAAYNFGVVVSQYGMFGVSVMSHDTHFV